MLERDLQDIGLNEKEAKVYLASLELGQAVAQDIAKKAAVNRATTYFVIEGLMKMGLMSSFHKGKKQYFIAADPDRLVEILEQEKKRVIRQEENLKKLLPQLQSINNKNENRPVVKYYEGKEGIMTMLDEYIKTAKGTVRMAYSADAVNRVFTEDEKIKARNRRLARNIKTKVIYTYTNGNLENTPSSDRRKVPLNKFPIKSDIAVYNDTVRIASLGERLIGIIIKDKEIASSLEAIIDLAWEGAEKYNK